MVVKLYVGNLPYSTTEKDLRLLFARAGPVISVNLMQDRQMGRSKGFAFVIMGTQADAQTATSMFNAYPVGDREMIVKPVKTREAPGRDSSRLSAFAPADGRARPRKPRETGSGYESRLSAFGAGNSLNGPRRRGGNQRD